MRKRDTMPFDESSPDHAPTGFEPTDTYTV